jgi:hypothetical protein
MKQILFFALLFIGSLSANAQDVITTRKGTVIQAKVTEVTPTEVKYKRFDNLDGPNYSAKKSEIASIVYKNGTVDAFGAAETNKKSASEKNAESDSDEESEVRNEFTLGVNGGTSLPLGAYASAGDTKNNTGNASAGGIFSLDLGSNFKGSRFGWLLTGFMGSHYNNTASINSTNYTFRASGVQSNSGILLGASYALPVINRSALIFSLQLGHITTTTPSAYTKIQTGSSDQPQTFQLIQTNVNTGNGSGLLLDMGASYRLHFRKTHFYMLGKLNYQAASINVSNQRVTTETTVYNAQGWPVSSYLYTTNSFTYPYAALNLQFGCGFFLK